MFLADSSISSRYPIIFSLYGIVTLKPLILLKLIFLKSLILSISKFKYSQLSILSFLNFCVKYFFEKE